MTGDATRTIAASGRILPDGTRLADRYTIRRLLGVGAMGMVYLARDEELDIDVALKVLRTTGAGGEKHRERFRSELVLARQISHRNVVRIHDIGQSDDLIFISMDAVEGRSLKQLLETDGALPAERAVQIAVELADALDEAHRAGIVHRDLKPANVLIAEDRAYLTDFGIATSLNEEGLTRTGEIVGTLDYLAPEQARGKAVDGRADLYALGLLLLEMITGKLPAVGATTMDERLARRALAEPREMLAGMPDLPAGLAHIVERCLATDPDDRYPDAAALAADLRLGRSRHRWPLRPRALLRVAAAVSAVALLFVGWQQYRDEVTYSDDFALASRPIAVLPFSVAVRNADPASIAHGLAELLGEQLAAGNAVQIVPPERVADTMRDLGLDRDDLATTDLELLGDLLDASYVIAGRLQQINDAYHIEARLRLATSGELLHRVSSEVADEAGIFTSLGPLSADLLDNLNVPMSGDSLAAGIADSAALRSYARGVGRLAAGDALAAIDPLRAAVETAPGFALAWDRLAQALATAGRDAEALQAADRAVSALGEQGGRGAALIRARRAALAGRHDDAIRTLEGLLIRQPKDADVRFRLASLYGDSGQLQSAETALKRVVTVSPDHPRAWYLLGKFAILRGDARLAADDYLVKALVIQNRLENSQGRGDVLNALGIASAQLGDTREALDYYEQAVELRRETGDDRGVAAVLANVARIEMGEGHYDEARAGLMEARDTLAAIGDRWTTANLENELGYLEEQRGRFDSALQHYREGLRIRRDLGDRRALAESYNNVSYTYYLLGDYDNAAVFNDQSTATYRETGNAEGIMLASQIRGILNTARGRYDDALEALLESLRLARELDNPHAIGVAQGYIGRVRHLQGHYAAAAESFDAALGQLRAIGDERGLAEFTLRDAQLALATGSWDAASAAIARADELIDRDDNPARRALQLRVDGALLESTGEPREAAARYREALARARESGDRVAVLQARLALTSHGDATGGPARIGELRAIHGEATRLGHGELGFEASIALSRELLDVARVDEADQLLRAALLSDHAASGARGDYRLHLLHADVLTAQSRLDDANSAWEQASAAVRRALDAQNEGQRRAFVQRENVKRVLARAGTANDIG